MGKEGRNKVNLVTGELVDELSLPTVGGEINTKSAVSPVKEVKYGPTQPEGCTDLRVLWVQREALTAVGGW